MILFAQNRGPKAELQYTESMKYIKNKTQNGKRETRPNMKQRTKGEMGRPKETLLEIAIKQTHILLNRAVTISIGTSKWLI